MIAASLVGAGDFFQSSTWYVIRNLAYFFVLVFWVATVYWVYKDASRRIDDRVLVMLSTALGIVPFVGPLIYMLFRPPEYLEDVEERRLEIRAMEKRLGGGLLQCTVCAADVEEDFRVCPVCATRLRTPCRHCERPLEAAWKVCPYCEAPVAGVAEVAAVPKPAPKPAPPAAAPVPEPEARQRRAPAAG